MKKVMKFVKKKRKDEAEENVASPGAGAGAGATPSPTPSRRSSGAVGSALIGLLKGRRLSSSSVSVAGYPGGASGASKLHLAVWMEDLEKVKQLAGRNDARAVNACDAGGCTPLHLAAQKGVVALVWPLLSHGASVQVRDAQGATPLHR